MGSSWGGLHFSLIDRGSVYQPGWAPPPRPLRLGQLPFPVCRWRTAPQTVRKATQTRQVMVPMKTGSE